MWKIFGFCALCFFVVGCGPANKNFALVTLLQYEEAKKVCDQNGGTKAALYRVRRTYSGTKEKPNETTLVNIDCHNGARFPVPE